MDKTHLNDSVLSRVVKKTKIVATIGPASSDKKVLKAMVSAGMNVARLNFSHGEYDVITQWVKNIRSVSDNVAIMLDTKGPEIRTGKVEGGEVELKRGQPILLTSKEQVGTSKKLTVRYPKLGKLKKGNTLLIDDGMIELEVQSKTKEGIKAKVIYGGLLGSQKTVTVRGHSVEIPFLSKKDKDDIAFGIKQEMDFVAASFVRKKKDIVQLRKFLKDRKSRMKIIAKIEHWEAVDNIDEIIDIADGVMVARGDLGVEMPLEKVPGIQAEIVEKCNKAGKPVIVATQMLESMTHNPRPTRAEVGDVAQAILQGTDAVMLSGETAKGKYPARSVRTMAIIAKEYDLQVEKSTQVENHESISLFIARAAEIGAKSLNSKLIFTPTRSGFTARNVSRFKPKAPIVAVTQHPWVFKQLQLSWGVIPVLDDRKEKELEKIIYEQIKNHAKMLKKDDTIIVTAGYHTQKKGKTNLLEIYRVSDILSWTFK